MNVFVIPSWYPHRCTPLHGIFFLEQAIALGELRPEWRIAVSAWGQGEGRISLAHFLKSPRCLVDALRPRRSGARELRPNVVEFFNPTLSWNEEFRDGNREGILAANRRNLESARRRFGRIDVLHAHVSYPAGWVAMRMSAETGIPYVVTEHMGPFPLAVYTREDGELEPFIREPLERANAVIAVSPALRDRIASFGIRSPEYVPNVLDERLFRIESNREDGDAFVFFTLCQMEPIKGIPDLLKAIVLLLERLPEERRGRVRFRLGGDGTRIESFKDEARRLVLDPWVTWLGFLDREAAAREYRGANCFVLASHFESFGIVLIEAMASGKPVIATRSGGPETIVTPENGVLVDIGSPPALADAMFAMLEGRKEYDPEALRRGVVDQFSRAAVVDRLETVYRRLVA